MNRDSHKNALKRVRSTKSINSFFFRSQPSFSKSSTISVSANAVYAEFIWPLPVAQKNFSASFCDGKSETFKTMFLDSKVHCHFTIGTQIAPLSSILDLVYFFTIN